MLEKKDHHLRIAITDSTQTYDPEMSYGYYVTMELTRKGLLSEKDEVYLLSESRQADGT
jgi:hypothetical protein